MTFKYIKQKKSRDRSSSRPDFERQSNSAHAQRLVVSSRQNSAWVHKCAVNSRQNLKIPAGFALKHTKCPVFVAFVLFVMLVLPLLFASCGNMFNNNGTTGNSQGNGGQSGSSGTSKAAIGTIHGILLTNGALPEEIVAAQRRAADFSAAQSFAAEKGNERTAIPVLPDLSTISYNIEIYEDSEQLTESDGVIVHITPTGTGASYSVGGLSYGTYTLISKAYILRNGSNVQILESEEKEITLSETSSVFMEDFDLRPTAEGEGYINLDVNFDFDFNATSYSCEANIWTVSNGTTSSVPLATTYGTNRITLKEQNASGIASGSYPVTINFYKLGGSTGSSSSSSGSSSGSGNSSSTSGRVLMYTIDEVINVCDGLTTSVWTKNGDAPHLFPSENGYICKVTSSMMDQFVATNYFVDNDDGNDNNLGSYFDPFKTISHAIDYVNTTGGNKAYTIRIKGTFNESIDISASKTSGVSSLTIKKSVQNADAIIDGTDKNASVVTISTAKPLTFENLTIQNGSVNGNGAGVNIVDSENANNGAHVTFTGCTITGNTAGTSNSSQHHGGGMSIGCYATVTLTDCVISENICQGNSDSSGGGMIVKTNATVTLIGCEISDNESVNAGGIMSTGELELTDCTIGNNTASIGGAMYIENEASFGGEMSIPAGIGQGHNDIYLRGSSAKIALGNDFTLSGDPARLDFESYIHNSVVFTGSSTVVAAAASEEIFTVTNGLFSLTTNGKLSLNPNIYVSETSSGSSGSTAGSDTTGDGTSAAPYATVTKALQRIKDLNTSLQFVIYVSGTINDAITLNSSTFGTNAPTSIKICGTDKDNDKLDGNDKNASIVSIKTAIPVTLEKLTIQNASTTESDGGGIYIEDNNGESTVTITDCNITANTTGGNGGAIYITRSSNNPLNLSISGCNITNNTATGGGGIWMQNEGGTVTIQNTTLSGNTAGQGAGIRVWRGAPVFTGCTFSNNNAGNGGAVSVATSVTFDGDTSIAAGDGQGHNDIYLGDSDAKINIGDDFSLTGNNAMIRANSENNGITENRVVLVGSADYVSTASGKFDFDSLLYKINGSGKLAVITEWYVSSTSSTPAGNNTTRRGTEASPFETVTDVLDTIKDVFADKDFVIHINGIINDSITLAPSASGAQPNSITICGTNMTTDGIQATVDFPPEPNDPEDPESNDPEDLDAFYAAMSVITNSLTNPVTIKNLKITGDIVGFDPDDPDDPDSLNAYVSIYNNGTLILENFDATPPYEGSFCALPLGEDGYLDIKGKILMDVHLPEGKLINIIGALNSSSRIGVFVDEGNEPTAPTATSDGTVTVTSGLGENSGLSAADVGTVFYSADDKSYAVRMNAATVTAGTEVVVGLSGGSFSSETLSDRLYFTMKNAASGGNNVTSFYTGYTKDLYITATRGSSANATVVSPSNLTYSILLKCGGATTATLLSTTQTPTVQGNAVKVTIPTTVEYPDSYTVFVQATYSVNGVTYDASFSLEGKEWLGAGDPPPDGFVAVTGATVTGAVGSGDTASSVFIAGRTVEIPDMYVCDHEVTQAEYQAVMGANPSNFNGSSGKEPADGEIQENRPVEKVSWYNALVYCNKKSIAENLTPCYTINGSTNPTNWGTVPTSSNETWNAVTCNFNANGYRLPTEAEWEYIARGGNGLTSTQTTYSGTNSDSDLTNYAWYTTNSGDKTHEVRKKNANSLGIYDMTGNVWEWCWDWYGSITSGTAATGASSGSRRVLRGGSWHYDASGCRVAFRSYYTPGRTDYDLGFRVVRTVQ